MYTHAHAHAPPLVFFGFPFLPSACEQQQQQLRLRPSVWCPLHARPSTRHSTSLPPLVLETPCQSETFVAVLHMGKWSLRSNNSSRMHRGNAEFSRRWIPPWSRSLFSHVGPQTLLVFREIIIAECNVYARALIKDYLSCSRWRCSFVDHKGGKTPYSMILILFLCNMNRNVQFHRLGTGFSFLI